MSNCLSRHTPGLLEHCLVEEGGLTGTGAVTSVQVSRAVHSSLAGPDIRPVGEGKNKIERKLHSKDRRNREKGKREKKNCNKGKAYYKMEK